MFLASNLCTHDQLPPNQARCLPSILVSYHLKKSEMNMHSTVSSLTIHDNKNFAHTKKSSDQVLTWQFEYLQNIEEIKCHFKPGLGKQIAKWWNSSKHEDNHKPNTYMQQSTLVCTSSKPGIAHCTGLWNTALCAKPQPAMTSGLFFVEVVGLFFVPCSHCTRKANTHFVLGIHILWPLRDYKNASRTSMI